MRSREIAVLDSSELLQGLDEDDCKEIFTKSIEASNCTRQSSALASRPVLILTLVAGIGGLLFGYDTGVISGALPYVRDDLLQPHAQDAARLAFLQEVIVSAAIVAAGAGSAAGGALSDALGRKRTLLLADLLFTLGALVMGLALGAGMLIAGRVLVGLGVGLASVTVPVYIAECAPPEVRAQLVTVNVLLITGGQFLAYLVDFLFTFVPGTWRWMLGVAAVPSVAQALWLTTLPESPKWLAGRGRTEAAERAAASLQLGAVSPWLAVAAEGRAAGAEQGCMLADEGEEALRGRRRAAGFLGMSSRGTGIASHFAGVGGGRGGGTLKGPPRRRGGRGGGTGSVAEEEGMERGVHGSRSGQETDSGAAEGQVDREDRALLQRVAALGGGADHERKGLLGGGQSGEGRNEAMWGQERQQRQQYSPEEPAVWQLLTSRTVLRQLHIGVGLQVLQQLCGINTVMYYTPAILELAGFHDKRTALLLALLPAGVNAAGTVVGMVCIDRYGRRKLLLASLAAVLLALLSLGAAFHAAARTSPPLLPGHASCGGVAMADCTSCLDAGCGFCGAEAGDLLAAGACIALGAGAEGKCSAEEGLQLYRFGCPSRYTALILAGLMAYLAAFSPGLGPVPWAVNAEIYPLAVRGLATGIAATSNWVTNAVVAQTFLTLTHALGSSGAFWAYAAAAGGGLVWAWWCVPETSGLSLDQIQTLFSGRELKTGLVGGAEGEAA